MFARAAAARAGAREPDADVVDDRVVRLRAAPPAHTPHGPVVGTSDPHRLVETSGRAAVIVAGVGAIASTCSADHRVT